MISLPSSLKVVEKKGNRAVFEIEGLYPGYGVTVGNSLRRVLLSSLEGAAITQVKIGGASHEFSTIPGVLEDILQLTMNLKKVRCKMFGDEPQKLELSVKGEQEVKAGDFKVPTQLEIMNKDAHIATLTSKNASLEMDILVERGVGYAAAERRKKEKLEIGTMELDAIFTPMKRVAFRMENMRVGDRTDFDRLFLDVETDGTITPEDALTQAADILVGHFSRVKEAFVQKEAPPRKRAAQKEEKGGEDASKIPVESLKLSKRTITVLLDNNIKTSGGISRKSEANLLELEGMGEKGIAEIKKALKKLGLEIQ
ncbi:MAG: DNA-directed RNA polymerase subunit alpha [Candidatus Wildermuthbacteria bacterium RIFCSPLOWO2_02_FULL_47_10]|uniref:DNA-directed RNA polymerase subunit alpha n=1 Tax=Candidatus Wildermuthbacteria bacterium RIFCSPHIGHO2_02_FULL_47_17 TaxID=1802452 RepID=A0A1G2R6R4_9BACT|nr:MAG: DNA-directed RNA polymerase subunit alpha [Candidatus Wildermuthbacteria bacterium RIFCSPHIGHO2_02_FULL_47_17]OHA75644.1 MAG: DNA-directed RNA polymerase subunit alpha [Candidatus Wildermuthbacteria bacterium RIFCSPLOWO2_02_FULL_47_10]